MSEEISEDVKEMSAVFRDYCTKHSENITVDVIDDKIVVTGKKGQLMTELETHLKKIRAKKE